MGCEYSVTGYYRLGAQLLLLSPPVPFCRPTWDRFVLDSVLNFPAVLFQVAYSRLPFLFNSSIKRERSALLAAMFFPPRAFSPRAFLRLQKVNLLEKSVAAQEVSRFFFCRQEDRRTQEDRRMNTGCLFACTVVRTNLGVDFDLFSLTSVVWLVSFRAAIFVLDFVLSRRDPVFFFFFCRFERTHARRKLMLSHFLSSQADLASGIDQEKADLIKRFERVHDYFAKIGGSQFVFCAPMSNILGLCSESCQLHSFAAYCCIENVVHFC